MTEVTERALIGGGGASAFAVDRCVDESDLGRGRGTGLGFGLGVLSAIVAKQLFVGLECFQKKG
eukprot:m.23707 g.23707  ORF g.23707 m.23707 type:complete len:64 (-) comp14319_c0_seq1:296-487(-)